MQTKLHMTKPLNPEFAKQFTPETLNEDGSLRVLQRVEENRNAVYITNQFGKKLLKLSIRGENRSSAEDIGSAQIKIIRYGLKKACVWRDEPNDPKIISLSLPKDMHHPVPLFALETGYSNQIKNEEQHRKKAHYVATEHSGPVRFDFYLAAKGFSYEKFVMSAYFFNMFSTIDYLSKAQSGVFNSGQIIGPILFLPVRDFVLVARRSVSNYNGQPMLHFYQNRDYYSKLMDRPTAYQNADGTYTWSTLREDEERINAL